MDNCSFYGNGVTYALAGNVGALVVRVAATTFGRVFPSQTKDAEETVTALQMFRRGLTHNEVLLR